MCTEDIHFYPTCGCTCCYRKPCYNIVTRSRNHICHGLIRPLTFTAQSGICPPCQTVLRCQRSLRSNPETYGTDVYLTEMRKDREYFSGTVWVQAADGRFSEDEKRSGELLPQLDGEISPKTSVEVIKKAWTEGVRWTAEMGLLELREGVRAWAKAKENKAEAMRKAREEAERRERVDMGILETTGSRGSWRSWITGDDKAWQRHAGHAGTENGRNVVTVKVKGPSRWRRWRAWFREFRKDLLLG